jgi:HTH-type transcriptional regulator/antitoxin HigA
VTVDIKPIKNERDHEKALTRIKDLWDRKDQASRDALDVIATLVQVYEDERYPIESVPAIDAIKFAMEQNGYEQPDLAKLLGSRSRAAEILNGKRGLNLRMIRKLHEEWGVPLESLVLERKAVPLKTLVQGRKARLAKRKKHSSAPAHRHG